MNHWLAEGRTLGASLRRFTCIVVAGADPEATADVALGIAETQAKERRVVLGDLLGDAIRFAPLRVDDDPHGLADAFHYGISLARVARPIAATPGLLFAPTGSDVVDYAELLGHGRWPRMIASFTELDELFVIALPLGALGLEKLVAHSDGVVLVDGQAPARLDPERVIARIQPPRPAQPPPPQRVSVSSGSPQKRAGSSQSARTSSTAFPPPRPTSSSARMPSRGPPAASRHVPGLSRRVIVGSLLTLVGALFIYWLADRFADRQPAKADVLAGLLKRGPAAARRNPSDPNLADPADSGAAAYAVQLMAANTQAGAILKLREQGSSLPAATYAPVAIQGKTWFKVLAGAYTTRGGADSLLTSLRAARLLDSTDGVVVRVPYALRIDIMKDSATVGDYLASIRVGRNIPAYTLYQRNGSVWIMVGAFETASQADMYAQTLRATGQPLQLVLRQGRTY